METREKTSQPQTLSFGGKVDVILAVISVISTTVWSIFTSPRRSEKDAPSLLLHVGYASLRKATTRLSALQLQWISPSTDEMYEQCARSLRITPTTVTFGSNGAKGHWIGNKDAQHVLIWYHGGGFCLPANAGYFKFLNNLVEDLGKVGKDLAVFVLTYTLAPHARYPSQLTQAVETLRYIISDTGRRPPEILLGGDSAGGNLAIGVLSHLAHPHPEIPRVDLNEPLAGTVLMSPWTSLDEKNSDKDVYSGGDLITPHVGRPWSRRYLGGASRDNYTDASDAPSTWFEAYPVEKILVLAGGNEILKSNIDEFVTNLKVGFPSTEYFVGHREGHVAPIYNIYVGDSKETQQGKKLKAWLQENL